MEWLGLSRRTFRCSMGLGVLSALILCGVYYPIFLHYIVYILRREEIGLYSVFADVVWCPVYEEVAYRSFALTHFADLEEAYTSTRNLVANLSQSLLFINITSNYT